MLRERRDAVSAGFGRDCIQIGGSEVKGSALSPKELSDLGSHPEDT